MMPTLLKTNLETEMGAPVVTPDVPEQSIRSVRLEPDEYPFVHVGTQVVGRQTLKVILQPSVPVEGKSFASGGRQDRQRRRLSPVLALR